MQRDLYFRREAAWNAVIRVLNSIGVVLLLWAISIEANTAQAGRDYLLPAPEFLKFTGTAVTARPRRRRIAAASTEAGMIPLIPVKALSSNRSTPMKPWLSGLPVTKPETSPGCSTPAPFLTTRSAFPNSCNRWVATLGGLTNRKA